jgi:hypothetical protein
LRSEVEERFGVHDWFGGVQHAGRKAQLFAKNRSDFWVGRIRKLSERHHGRERERRKESEAKTTKKNTAMMIDVRGFNDADVETTKEWENPLAA